MAPAMRLSLKIRIFTLSPYAIGRFPDDIGDLRKLLRQRARLAPNHADGARWFRGIKPRDGNGSRSRFDTYRHFGDEGYANP